MPSCTHTSSGCFNSDGEIVHVEARQMGPVVQNSRRKSHCLSNNFLRCVPLSANVSNKARRWPELRPVAATCAGCPSRVGRSWWYFIVAFHNKVVLELLEQVKTPLAVPQRAEDRSWSITSFPTSVFMVSPFSTNRVMRGRNNSIPVAVSLDKPLSGQAWFAWLTAVWSAYDYSDGSTLR